MPTVLCQVCQVCCTNCAVPIGLCQLCCDNCALGVVNEHRSGLRAMMFEYVGCAVASASIVSAVLLHTFFVCGDITELDNEA